MAWNVIRNAVIGATLAAIVAAGAVGTTFIAKSKATVQSLTFACTPGVEDVYGVDYTSSGILEDPTFGIVQTVDSTGPKVRVEANVHGKMHAVCVANTPEEHTLALTFDGLTGALDLPNGGDGGGPASALLSGTTFVTRDARGRTRGLSFDGLVSEGGKSIVRELLALAQVTAPKFDGATTTWTSREEDSNGPYEASYEVADVEGDMVSLTKVRANVQSSMKQDALRPHANRTEETKGQYRVDRAKKRVESADTTAKVELIVGRRTVGRSESRLALTRERSAPLPKGAIRALNDALTSAANGAPASDLAARDVDARLERRIQRKELGEETWTSLSAMMKDEKIDGTKVFLKLKALFLLEPARCAEAGRTLAEMTDPNGRAFPLLAGALASAGHQEAQRALVLAAHNTEGRLEVQRTIVATTGMVKAPSPETFEGLRRLADGAASTEMRGTARLALGSLARAGADSDPGRASAAEASEEREFRVARTSDEKVLALLALGNMGSPAAMDVVRDALEDSDARVRAAAASALRFVALADAESILVDLVVSDADPGVRTEAVRSLTLRTVGTRAMNAVLIASERDADEQVRMAAVQMIGGEIVGDPLMKDVLARVASNDRAQGVRNAAKLALLRFESAG